MVAVQEKREEFRNTSSFEKRRAGYNNNLV